MSPRYCVIPVAGRATRLAARGIAGPKALISIGGRLLIDHLLDRLPPSVTDVCCVQDPDETVSRWLGAERRGRSIGYAIQPEPLGVGDAVLRARHLISGPTLVVMGDVYYEEALGPYVEALLGADGGVLIERTGPRTSHPIGLVHLDDDKVTRIYKAPYGGDATRRVGGLFLLPAAAWEIELNRTATETGEFELEQIVQTLIDEGYRFEAAEYGGWRRNVNAPEDLRAVERRLRSSSGEMRS